jgi:hypothetical protein
MIVSTPALKNTSIISAIASTFVTMRSTDVLLAAVQWVYPKNQFVPIIIRDVETVPTEVRGKLSIRKSSFDIAWMECKKY